MVNFEISARINAKIVIPLAKFVQVDACSECNEGYLIDVSKSKNPFSKDYFLNASKICKLCQTDYGIFVYDNKCTESKGGKFLLNSRCVTSCSAGCFESNYTKCEKFKTNCKSFNTLSECDECRVKRNE